MSTHADPINQNQSSTAATALVGRLPGPGDTDALGAALADTIPSGPPLVVFLHGNLGAGKTALVRACVLALGWKGVVKSPTYTLLELYDLDNRRVCHFDLYRLAEPEELEYIGHRDYLENNTVWFVEWPELGQGVLPTADIDIALATEGAGRSVQLQAQTTAGSAWLQALAETDISGVALQRGEQT